VRMDFYLFDVEHGQCAAIRLPNGRWCVFDAGKSRSFSPIKWIISQNVTSMQWLVDVLHGTLPRFTVFKATITHCHHDHFLDYEALLSARPKYLRVEHAKLVRRGDVPTPVFENRWKSENDFRKRCKDEFLLSYHEPDYGDVSITELSLPPREVLMLGGDQSNQENNSSVISRIDCYGNSILLCGDMEKEAWDHVLRDLPQAMLWQPLVTNVDILVAPHHGHSSGYCQALMELANPAVVLASVASLDPSVDSRYSQVAGIVLGGRTYRRITTRNWGHIHVSISRPDRSDGKGEQTWYGVPASRGTWPPRQGLWG